MDALRHQRGPRLRRINAETRRGKYDVFFDVTPLYLYAVHLAESPDADLADVRAAAVVLIRITTMMRSGDLAEVLPQLFVDGQQITYLRFSSKTGHIRTVAIEGPTLRAVLHYAELGKVHHGTRLIQYLDGSHRSLSSQRIAKVALMAMHAVGIDQRSALTPSVVPRPLRPSREARRRRSRSNVAVGAVLSRSTRSTRACTR